MVIFNDLDLLDDELCKYAEEHGVVAALDHWELPGFANLVNQRLGEAKRTAEEGDAGRFGPYNR